MPKFGRSGVLLMEKNTNGSMIEPDGILGSTMLSASLHPLYTATAEISSDPAGALYSAKYEAEGRKVLVKALAPGLYVDRDLWSDVPNEVLKLLDTVTGVHKNTLLVLEFPKASSLRRILARQGNMTVGPAVAVTVQVLNVLRYLHERGHVFGTLNSGALFLMRTASGKLKIRIAFLGLSKSELPVNLDRYLPPEAESPRHRRSRADDLWAAATLLYEMLFGLMPFSSGTKDVEGNKVPFVPPAFSSENAALAGFVRRALHADPAERFASAEVMTAALLGKKRNVVIKRAETHDRSSIPTVPAPPSDLLVYETSVSDEEITKACSFSNQLALLESVIGSERSLHDSDAQASAFYLSDEKTVRRNNLPARDSIEFEDEEENTTLYLPSSLTLANGAEGKVSSSAPRNSSDGDIFLLEDDVTTTYSTPALMPAGRAGNEPLIGKKRRRLGLSIVAATALLVVSVSVLLPARKDAAQESAPVPGDAVGTVHRAAVSPALSAPNESVSEKQSAAPGSTTIELLHEQVSEESEALDTDRLETPQVENRGARSETPNRARRKAKPVRQRRGKPKDDLSSNPFPLKTNPFPVGETQ